MFAALTALVPSLALVLGVTAPAYTTSAPDGMWNPTGRYFVANGMWNASGGMTQHLRAWSKSNWSVTAHINGTDTAVKSYPNVHKDFIDWGTGAMPRLNKFRLIRSTFSSQAPARGRWNVAYDIWLNGVGNGPGVNELMIWTHNRNQVPAGRVRYRDVRIAGRRWNVWATNDHGYLALVPVRGQIDSGVVPLKATFAWLQRHKLLPTPTRLGQIDYGIEFCHTGNGSATFTVNRFGVQSPRK